MTFPKRKRKAVLTGAVYALMCGGILWQLFHFIPEMKNHPSDSNDESIVVNVNGNVLHPGQYRVPAGTTNFEILKVAGIRPTSNIAAFNLTDQITNNQQLQVGTMPNPVVAKKETPKIRGAFFVGDVSIIAPDGKTRPPEKGMEMNSGDRLITEDRAQAELSVADFSRIDMDNFSEIVFDKINTQENAKTLNAVSQRSGVSWYKITYGSKDELFRVATPLATITVAGNGADFTVTAKPDEIHVDNMDGLLLIERVGGVTEAINLISGQSVAVYNDSRPFQVSPVSSDANPADRFSTLTKEKTTFMLQRMPMNFVFCGVPGVYFFGSLQYETGVLHLVNIPPETSVEEYVQGCSTLNEAFLYGGGIFVTTLIEQIMDARIQKFLVLEKEDILKIAGIIGGLKVDVDEKAASSLKLVKGSQRLSKGQLGSFLNPSLSGTEDFKKRENIVIKSFFNELSTKNLVVTAIMVEQILTNVQTNMTVQQVMDEYSKFTAVQSWVYKEHALPVKRNMRNGKVVYDPIRDECQSLLKM